MTAHARILAVLFAASTTLVACSSDTDSNTTPAPQDSATSEVVPSTDTGSGGTDTGSATDSGGATEDSGASEDSTAGDTDVSETASETGASDASDDGATGVSCVGKTDGTECGGGNICLKEVCGPSTCGDGFINAKTGEDCEDGNTVSGDGCSACKFDCKADTDCDDANDCTTNTCDKSTAGKQLCKSAVIAGTPSCKLSSTETGTCKSGTCVKAGCGNTVKEGTEECDDGNTDPADGCKNDCTFTCKADADCDDGNACNGVETCNTTTHVCVAGTAVSCGTKGSCAAAGTCNPATGACTYSDLDKDGVACDTDCNDADPAIFPGAPECKDGKDNNCNGLKEDNVDCVCYADSDGDGYALATATTVTATVCPSGYTRRAPIDAASIDCREGNVNVNPGVGTDATKWFQTPYCTSPLKTCALYPELSTYSFDYDCDKVEEKRWNTVSSGSCPGALGKGCLLRSGWITASPACGKSGSYRTCTWTGTTCIGSETTRTQECK